MELKIDKLPETLSLCTYRVYYRESDDTEVEKHVYHHCIKDFNSFKKWFEAQSFVALNQHFFSQLDYLWLDHMVTEWKQSDKKFIVRSDYFTDYKDTWNYYETILKKYDGELLEYEHTKEVIVHLYSGKDFADFLGEFNTSTYFYDNNIIYIEDDYNRD